MKLFTKDEKKSSIGIFPLLAVADGEVVDLAEVPDEAFSSGMLGEGYALRPDGETIFSPAKGVIESISDSRHAYAVTSEIGDILVHIGIDSVKVPEAFEPIVKVGDCISAGQPIARADLRRLREAEIDTIIPVIITDRRTAGEIKIKYGKVRGGRDAGLFLEIQRK